MLGNRNGFFRVEKIKKALIFLPMCLSIFLYGCGEPKKLFSEMFPELMPAKVDPSLLEGIHDHNWAAFLTHNAFLAFEPDDYFGFELFFYANFPVQSNQPIEGNAPAKDLSEVRLFLGEEELGWDLNTQITTFARNNNLESDYAIRNINGFSVALSGDAPPAGSYAFNKIQYLLNGVWYTADIGYFEIEISDQTETQQDIYIDNWMIFTSMKPIAQQIMATESTQFFFFEIRPDIGDIVIKQVDTGYLNDILNAEIKTSDPNDPKEIKIPFMFVHKNQVRKIHMLYTEYINAERNIILKPWLVYEYNGIERRRSLERMTKLLSVSPNNILEIMENKNIIDP